MLKTTNIIAKPFKLSYLFNLIFEVIEFFSSCFSFEILLHLNNFYLRIFKFYEIFLLWANNNLFATSISHLTALLTKSRDKIPTINPTTIKR